MKIVGCLWQRFL